MGLQKWFPQTTTSLTMGHEDPYNGEEGLSSQFKDLGVEDSGALLRTNLLRQCQSLFNELEEFQQYLIKQKKNDTVEMRHFKNSVKTEIASLEKLSNADPEDHRTLHILRSSNLPFYAAVWNCAKCCTGIAALEKRYYWTVDKKPHFKVKSDSVAIPQPNRCNAMVDIVAQDGAEWVKVSTLTEKRLLFDMAKAGWQGESSSDSSDASDEDFEPEGLMKQAEALIKASRATRVRYRHPSVRIVLPKIKKGGAKEMDELIKRIETLGINVQTSEDITDATPVSEVLDRMVVDPFVGFSSTINVDCTILLALVSDLSHGRVQAEDWHHRAIIRQIEMESGDTLLPNSLWPAMGCRVLTCSGDAAKRMHEIVDLIGTKTEKQRRDSLMEVESTAHWSVEQRIRNFQELSTYDVPVEWKIPIKVVDLDIETVKAQLPPTAEQVAKILSPINQSVFLYGWANGLTTISSNRTVAREIEVTIEAHRLAEDEAGPDVWLSPTARSLVGKEKNRRNRGKSED